MAQRDFNNIYLGVQDKIYRLAVGIVGDRDEAEDVVQDLYERLWRRRELVIRQHNPEGYILAGARNLCLDVLRRRGRRPQTELTPSMASPDESADSGEMTGIVARLIAALPERQQTVMRLRDVEGMGTDEIAVVMGIKETAVRMSLSRARSTVREKLVKITGYGI